MHSPFTWLLRLKLMLTATLVFLVLSVSHLHERWLKDCAFYREVYDPVDDVSRMPFIDWGPVFEDKQVRLIKRKDIYYEAVSRNTGQKR